MNLRAAVAVAVVAIAIPSPRAGAETRRPARNVILFVADGLRPGSINPADAPVLARLQHQGVFFANSHSVFPTFTTANASAIATGHQLGDTGDFANSLYVGAPIAGSVTPFIENDQVLAALDAHFEGNYLKETSLLAAARARGFSTAAVGKVGPTLIQDVTQGNRQARPPATIFLDDKTGSAEGIPLPPEIDASLRAELGGIAPPGRSNGKPRTRDDNGYAGDLHTPGTRAANVAQQQFQSDAVVRVILPAFKRRGAPFVLVFWSRDPDATQHNQGDGLDDLRVGINGPTSKRAVRNADDTLGRIWAAIQIDPALAASTDLFVTSDHGFSTLSRRQIDAAGQRSTSPAAAGHYPDVLEGALPPGFLALDIAAHLRLPLFDPDRQGSGAGTAARVLSGAHPANGNGLIGGAGKLAPHPDAKVIVAANGASDLIYIPTYDPATIADLAAFLLGRDYVDAVFVDAPRGSVPGALTLDEINLAGDARRRGRRSSWPSRASAWTRPTRCGPRSTSPTARCKRGRGCTAASGAPT